MATSIFFILWTVAAFAQGTAQGATTQRVNFTLSNPKLRQVQMDIRYFNNTDRQRIGYGYTLGPLGKLPDDKPVGTRIYLKKRGSWNLCYVISSEDAGKVINLNKKHEISREQHLQVAFDEMNERTEQLEHIDKNPDIESVSKQLGLEMVSLRVSGKNLVARQVHVRVQLPYLAERSNNGFCRKISRFDLFKVRYPVGTKIYRCDGPYWNKPVPEKLLLTVDAEKANYLVRL